MENMNEPKRSKQSKQDTYINEAEEKLTLTKKELQNIIESATQDAISNYIKEYKIKDQSFGENQNKLVEMIYLNRVSSDNVTYLDNNKLYSVRQLGDRISMPFNVLQASYDARERIKSRKLIVLSGLNSQERKIFGCDYKDGEVLSIEFINNVVDMEKDDIIDTFKSLCYQHRKLFAELIRDKLEEGNNRVNLDLIKSLIKICKKDNSIPEHSKEDEKILRSLVPKIEKIDEENEY